MAYQFAYVPSTQDGCTVRQETRRPLKLSDAARARRDVRLVSAQFSDSVDNETLFEDFATFIGRENESEAYWTAFSDAVDKMIDQHEQA